MANLNQEIIKAKFEIKIFLFMLIFVYGDQFNFLHTINNIFSVEFSLQLNLYSKINQIFMIELHPYVEGMQPVHHECPTWCITIKGLVTLAESASHGSCLNFQPKIS